MCMCVCMFDKNFDTMVLLNCFRHTELVRIFFDTLACAQMFCFRFDCSKKTEG